jgi:ribonuclease J
MHGVKGPLVHVGDRFIKASDPIGKVGEIVDLWEAIDGTRVICSMWDGHLEDELSKPFLQWMACNGLPEANAHTSGHASVTDVRQFAQAIFPRPLVSIHSFRSDGYPELFVNADPKEDGEWWTV